MPRNNKKLIIQRNLDICREFDRLTRIREGGVQKYNLDYILMRLRNKFYLEVSTIENIIKNPPKEQTEQMELFVQ